MELAKKMQAWKELDMEYAKIKEEVHMFAMIHLDAMWNQPIDSWGQRIVDMSIIMLQFQTDVEQDLTEKRMRELKTLCFQALRGDDIEWKLKILQRIVDSTLYRKLSGGKAVFSVKQGQDYMKQTGQSFSAKLKELDNQMRTPAKALVKQSQIQQAEEESTEEASAKSENKKRLKKEDDGEGSGNNTPKKKFKSDINENEDEDKNSE